MAKIHYECVGCQKPRTYNESHNGLCDTCQRDLRRGREITRLELKALARAAGTVTEDERDLEISVYHGPPMPGVYRNGVINDYRAGRF